MLRQCDKRQKEENADVEYRRHSRMHSSSRGVLTYAFVLQVGEELDGMVMIRSGDNRQGVCPRKFLQEV